jgi:hypothetical protein
VVCDLDWLCSVRDRLERVAQSTLSRPGSELGGGYLFDVPPFDRDRHSQFLRELVILVGPAASALVRGNGYRHGRKASGHHARPTPSDLSPRALGVAGITVTLAVLGIIPLGLYLATRFFPATARPMRDHPGIVLAAMITGTALLAFAFHVVVVDTPAVQQRTCTPSPPTSATHTKLTTRTAANGACG